MKIGAGKKEIQFPADFFPAEGFTSIYDSLHVRVVVLHGNEQLAILSAELTSLPASEIDLLKKIVSEETGVKEEHCWICVTHTFSAPHIMPDAALTTDAAKAKRMVLQNCIYAAARAAARMAAETVQDAVLKQGSSQCFVNINRDVETPDGWWVSNYGTGLSDKTVDTIYAEEVAGKPICILVYYAVQSSVMDGSVLADGGKAVTSDLAGAACAELEGQYPGATVIFLLGAAGDQAPVKKAKTLCQDDSGEWKEQDFQEAGISMYRELGHTLADCVREAIDMSTELMVIGEVVSASVMKAGAADAEFLEIDTLDFRVPAKQMNSNLQGLTPTRYYEYISTGEQEISIEAIRIGPVAMLGVKPELNCRTAEQIKGKSPFETTWVITMVNGGAKYMADAESYDRYTYEAMNSPYGKGAAEVLCSHAKLLLTSIYKNDNK